MYTIVHNYYAISRDTLKAPNGPITTIFYANRKLNAPVLLNAPYVNTGRY